MACALGRAWNVRKNKLFFSRILTEFLDYFATLLCALFFVNLDFIENILLLFFYVFVSPF